MRSRPNAILIIALLLTVSWSATSGAFDEFTPRDAKAQFLESDLVDDVSDEALAALAEVPGVGLDCTAGFAGPYPCDNVDLLGLVPLAEMGGAAGNDSWGWTAEDGTEIAIMGTGLGVAYIDVTDPVNPTVIGTTGQAGGPPLTDPFGLIIEYINGVVWRDVKVANDHAFIVSERGGGMQVVDLNEVIANPGTAARNVEPVATYTDQGANPFHNIVINEDTDTAFLVGVFGTTISSGGLHMVDISDPANPTFAGAFAADGYTHDAQCVLYDGPDADYNGTRPGTEQHEICFAYNEDTVTIVDVTDPTIDENGHRGTMLGKVAYDPQNGGTGVNNAIGSFYTHQGWLTPDHSFIVFNDELDEQNTRVNGLTGNTRTFMVELPDLDADYDQTHVQTYFHDTLSTDHNLYIVGDLIFQANYNAGLRVLRYTPEGLRAGELEEVGFFDVDPALDFPNYGGAWNVYPFFESGTILVSSLDEGLYTLRFNDPAAAAETVERPAVHVATDLDL